MGTIGAAVEQGLQVHACELAFLGDAGAEFHQYRMAAAVQVEHFFARETDFDRPAQHERRFRHHEFMTCRIALAAEAATVVAGNHADVRGRHLQHARQLAMQIVRILGARPERQLAIALGLGERGVLLHRHVVVALVEEQVFEYVVRFRQRLLHIAELERLVAMDVARVGIVVNARLRLRQRFLGRRDGRQRLVFHLDQLQRRGRRLLVRGDHRRHRIAAIAYLVAGQRKFILGNRQHAERHLAVGARAYRHHAFEGLGLRGVDRQDPCMRHRRAQHQLADAHCGTFWLAAASTDSMIFT